MTDATILSSKRAIYVGGLASDVTPILLRATMIPFGDIISVDIPMDYTTGTHKGFGFVEYEDPDDAIEAIFNMDGSDLMGKTLRVSMAQPNQISKLISGNMSSSQQHGAIWSNDEWFQQNISQGNSEQDKKEQQKRKDDQRILTETMR